MDIAVQVITSVVITFFLSLTLSYLVPVLRKKEIELEDKNREEKVVKTEWKKMPAMWLFPTCAVIANSAGIILIAAPRLLEQWLGIDILAVAVIWWIVLLVDDTILYLMFITAKYDNETITVKKPFYREKTYRFDDIIKFSHSGNLSVKTKNGKFILLNVMSGTQSLRNFLSSRENNEQK